MTEVDNDGLALIEADGVPLAGKVHVAVTHPVDEPETVAAAEGEELIDGVLVLLVEIAALNELVAQEDKVEVPQAEDDMETVRLLLCVGVLVPLDDRV